MTSCNLSIVYPHRDNGVQTTFAAEHTGVFTESNVSPKLCCFCIIRLIESFYSCSTSYEFQSIPVNLYPIPFLLQLPGVWSTPSPIFIILHFNELCLACIIYYKLPRCLNCPLTSFLVFLTCLICSHIRLISVFNLFGGHAL